MPTRKKKKKKKKKILLLKNRVIPSVIIKTKLLLSTEGLLTRRFLYQTKIFEKKIEYERHAHWKVGNLPPCKKHLKIV